MKKIYILTIVKLDSDGCVSFDTLKYDTRDEAQLYGEERLDEWVAENSYEDENGELTGVRVRHYPNLVEAMCTFDIAEFNYLISEFEV